MISNVTFPFISQADGSYALPGLGPQPIDQAGGYIVAIQTADNTTTVASATVGLTGTNTYYATTRLDG